MTLFIRVMIMMLLLAVAGAGFYGINYLKKLGPLPAGYVAHAICSGVFIAGRDFDEVLAHDVLGLQRRVTETHVDGNVVTTRFGIWP